MSARSLQLKQLDDKIRAYSSLKKVSHPSTGWIRAIRTALGMTLQQLANKLAITKQGVLDIERREKEGSITVKSLREIGQAIDMQFVYGFVPNDGTLEKLIEKRANELAIQIVLRTSHTMKLEAQENSERRIKKAIQEMTDELRREVPKVLWD